LTIVWPVVWLTKWQQRIRRLD